MPGLTKSRCQFVAVYPPMLHHIRMGKLAGWRPRGHHERVRESYMMNLVYYKCGDRDLPYCLSAGRKKGIRQLVICAVPLRNGSGTAMHVHIIFLLVFFD